MEASNPKSTKDSRRRRRGNIIFCRNGCGMSYDRRLAKENKKISYNFYNHERVTCKMLPMLECKICSREGSKKLIKGHLKMKQHLKTKGHLRRLHEKQEAGMPIDETPVVDPSSLTSPPVRDREICDYSCGSDDMDLDVDGDIEIKDEPDFYVKEEPTEFTFFPEDLVDYKLPVKKETFNLAKGIEKQASDLLAYPSAFVASSNAYLGTQTPTFKVEWPPSDLSLPFTEASPPVWPQSSPASNPSFTPQPLALFPSSELDSWGLGSSMEIDSSWERAGAQDPFCYL